MSDTSALRSAPTFGDPVDTTAARRERASRAAPWNTPGHPEWRSRGYVPHFDAAGVIQMVTFRLSDSLPASVLADFERANIPRQAWGRRIEEYLDAGHGACHLRDPRIGRLVEDALLHFDGERYRMIVWSVMPTHVHTLFETMVAYPLAKVLQSWKSYTAREANRMLGRSGTFWQPEYWDRRIRDEQHLANAIRYINERNRSPFSSAAWAGEAPTDRGGHIVGE
jgi:hypothetical protein